MSRENSDTRYRYGSLPDRAPLAMAYVPMQTSSEPSYEAGEALTLLQHAIAEAVALQDQSNSRQNRFYQERQDQYDSARQDAQSAYDKAKRRADRWR